MHFLSRDDGAPLNRLTPDGSAIAATPGAFRQHGRHRHPQWRRVRLPARYGHRSSPRAAPTRLLMKPVIALVGRPNVGKSTLFNRLTQTRDAIVADFAGLTRDRHYGNGRQGKHEFIVIDTGGFEPDAGSGIFKEMAKQTRQAVAEADVVIFVVDAREGLSAQDHDIANELRRLGKPCVLAANKAEGMQRRHQAGRLLRTRLGRRARRFGCARPGHARPGRTGARAVEPARARRRGGRRRRQTSRSSWRWPAGPTSASRR